MKTTHLFRWIVLSMTVVLLWALVPNVVAQERSPGCQSFNRNGSTNDLQSFHAGEELSVTITVLSGTIEEGDIHTDGVYVRSKTGTFAKGESISVSYTIPSDGEYNLAVGSTGSLAVERSFACVVPGGAGDIIVDGNVTILADGTVLVPPPDDRLNWGYGDSQVVLYPATTRTGAAALDVYCVNEDVEGTLAFQVTAEIVAAWDTSQPQEVPVMEACGAAFYVLDAPTEYLYQVNLAVRNGWVEVLCTDLSCAVRDVRFVPVE